MSAEKIAKRMINDPANSSRIFQDYVLAGKSESARKARFNKVNGELAKRDYEYIGVQWRTLSDIVSGEVDFGEGYDPYSLKWQGLDAGPELDIAYGNFSEAIDQQHEFESLEQAFDSYADNVLETAVEQKVDIDKAIEMYTTLQRRHEGAEKNPRPPEEFYFDVGPHEGVDLGVWREEVLQDTKAALHDPQLRILLGHRTVELLKRLADAPTRQKHFERVRAGVHIEPVEVPDADEGWYRDAVSGRWVVQEDNGTWYREVEHPSGAFTLGEMAELEARLWGAGEALAQAAESGILDQDQRQAALGVVEAADNLQMRLTIKKWHPDEATRREAKRTALEIIAGRDPEMKKLKRKLLR